MVLELQYEILDVFTSSPLSGNPLAVVTLSEGDLPQTTKQRIAKEFNLSETVFLHLYPHVNRSSSSSGSSGSKEAAAAAAAGETRVDIFTPEAELPFAGHPTIGSAVHLLDQFGRDETVLRVKAGPIRCFRARRDDDDDDDGKGYTYAEIPHHHHRHAMPVPVPGAATSAVAQSIVKGMNFALVPLSTLAELAKQTKELVLSVADLDEGWREGIFGTYFYVRDDAADVRSEGGGGGGGGEEESYRARMFCSFDGAGVEDAATGSAACTLASYLSDLSSSPNGDGGGNGGRNFSKSIRIMQGVEMGRPSEILVRTDRCADGDRLDKVVLGGKAVRIMKGTMTI